MNELHSGSTATRTPLLGASLNEMLNIASGKPPERLPTTEQQATLYEELHPKYDSEDMRNKIEQNCRYNTIKPHLIDASADIPEPVPIISHYGSVIASEGNISAVVGAAKSKKTFLCTALVGALLRPNGTVGFGIAPSPKREKTRKNDVNLGFSLRRSWRGMRPLFLLASP